MRVPGIPVRNGRVLGRAQVFGRTGQHVRIISICCSFHRVVDRVPEIDTIDSPGRGRASERFECVISVTLKQSESNAVR